MPQVLSLEDLKEVGYKKSKMTTEHLLSILLAASKMPFIASWPRTRKECTVSGSEKSEFISAYTSASALSTQVLPFIQNPHVIPHRRTFQEAISTVIQLNSLHLKILVTTVFIPLEPHFSNGFLPEASSMILLFW